MSLGPMVKVLCPSLNVPTAETISPSAEEVNKDMSCDTTKENASVVDSSLTEWKHEMGNLDDPESSSYKTKVDVPSEQGYSCERVVNSCANTKGKLYSVRYFIIKSLNHHNIQLSIQKGIWATQVMNEPILEEAFNNSGKVILIFSVNMSGFFQGYAQMMSSVGWRRDNVWSQGSGGNNPWGRSFKVKWLQLYDLPFQKTLHLRNPLNDFKPVKISRDCQELSQEIGEALCDLLDGKHNVESELKREEFPPKRSSIEPSCSLQGQEYNLPPVHVPWSRTPVLYPSLLYPYQVEASQFHLSNQRSTGAVPENFPATSAVLLKQSRINKSPLSSSLTEDDFLEMSYEDYVEVHSRGRKQFCRAVSSFTFINGT
ncbi:uncharacterized protein LOC131164081 isoform X2 [Malania oleifera]|uniref:uncharacterized protein LOC131164081 isoform X2 n=1 Tax=Malania oleifera TaxID=397392 RepID=UPI0025AE0D81|nr:uncharacterized protein LOC131164081 isoform X2 [Malania oleifera]